MKQCPSCEGARHYQLSDGRLKCRACGHRFSWTSGWDSVRLTAANKHKLLEFFVLGVPSYRQRFRSTVSAAARERFYRLLRACCAQVEQLREPFDGALEFDETIFGGARHGKRGWGAAGKVIVFGIIKRNGRVKAMPIPAHDRLSIMHEIKAHTREGALYYTDEWQAYATLKLRGEHVMIRKEKGRPVGATISTASKVSGAMPRTGCIRTVACLSNTSTFTWAKFATVTTTGTKTSNPCCLSL